MSVTGVFEDLRVGDRFTYRDVIVEVLADPAPYADRFGQELRYVVAKRFDTGTVGRMPFGLGGVYPLPEV